MNAQNQQGPPNKPNRPPGVPSSQLVFQSAEATTTIQLNNLLQMGSFALHALTRPVPAGDSFTSGAALPKEAEIAAELTFINACERMDAILKDGTRWDLSTQQKLQERFEAAHALNLDFLESQSKAARQLCSPHFRFKPGIHRLVDGRFAAILGNIDDLDNAIVGLGGTPAEALQRFDEVFENGVPGNMVEYLHNREAALENGQKTEPYPKQKTKETSNETAANSMDPERNRTTPKAPRRGKKQPDNS